MVLLRRPGADEVTSCFDGRLVGRRLSSGCNLRLPLFISPLQKWEARGCFLASPSWTVVLRGSLAVYVFLFLSSFMAVLCSSASSSLHTAVIPTVLLTCRSERHCLSLSPSPPPPPPPLYALLSKQEHGEEF